MTTAHQNSADDAAGAGEDVRYTENNRVCATCRAWDDDGDGTGRCRRLAPAPLLSDRPPPGGEIGVTWPVVCDDDWCGQWLAREPPR